MNWSDGRDAALAQCILPLSSTSHKGSSGRIAVLGGSARYTGAPYYAAMAALHTGADLAFVLTAEEAALPIKCYSPELMVAPVYKAADFDRIVAEKQMDSDEAQALVQHMVDQVVELMDRLHALIVGPGLGRCPLVMRAVQKILQQAQAQGLPIVIDADGLYMLSLEEYRHVLQGYDKVILTPNVVEYQRLFKDDDDDALAAAIVVKKGQADVIQRGKQQLYVCEEEGGLKRSGGIGDVLSGTIGALAAWHAILSDSEKETDLPLSCWTACCFVKRATKKAFAAKRRAMTAPDVLEALGPAIDEMTRET